MRDIAEVALLAGATVGELLVEAMRAEKTRVGPEEHAPCALRTRFALGERDELSRKAAPPHVVADVDAVQLGRLGAADNRGSTQAPMRRAPSSTTQKRRPCSAAAAAGFTRSARSSCGSTRQPGYSAKQSAIRPRSSCASSSRTGRMVSATGEAPRREPIGFSQRMFRSSAPCERSGNSEKPCFA